MKSITTTTTISRDVPPKWNGTPCDETRISGSRHTAVTYRAPHNVRRVRTLSMYSAVCCPGRMPRDERAGLLQIVSRVPRVEDQRGIEEAEEDDEQSVNYKVQRLAVAQRLRHVLHEPRHRPLGILPEEARQRGREQQQAGGENRRNHTRHVQLERQVALCPAYMRRPTWRFA